MTEPDLERLIGDWYRRDSLEGDALGLPASADCPPLTRLWRHHVEDLDLGEYADHVERCDGCRRIGDIIRRERFRVGTPVFQESEPRPSGSEKMGAPFPARREWGAGMPRDGLYRVYRRPLAAVAAVLATAACVAFLVISWPQPNYDAQVALAFERLYLSDSASVMRGPQDESFSGDAPAERDWVTQLLTDPAVQEAITTHGVTGGQILGEIGEGRLRINPDGRVTLADGIDKPTATRHGLNDLIQRDRDATTCIVDVLVRTLPGTSGTDRVTIRRALDRWRAENVFGTNEADDK